MVTDLDNAASRAILVETGLLFRPEGTAKNERWVILVLTEDLIGIFDLETKAEILSSVFKEHRNFRCYSEESLAGEPLVVLMWDSSNVVLRANLRHQQQKVLEAVQNVINGLRNLNSEQEQCQEKTEDERAPLDLLNNTETWRDLKRTLANFILLKMEKLDCVLRRILVFMKVKLKTKKAKFWSVFGKKADQVAQADGTFVLRRRNGQEADLFPFALSMAHSGTTIHFVIQKVGNLGFVLDRYHPGEKLHSSLMDLIEYYKENPISFRDNKTNSAGTIPLKAISSSSSALD